MLLKLTIFHKNSTKNEQISKNFLRFFSNTPSNFPFVYSICYPDHHSIIVFVIYGIVEKNLKLTLVGSSQSTHTDLYSEVHKIADNLRKCRTFSENFQYSKAPSPPINKLFMYFK